MRSRIFTGTLSHARTAPRRHAFTYPVYVCAFDLDELPALDAAVPGFGHNRMRPVAVHDRDYLDGARAPIRERLLRVAAAAGLDPGVERIHTVTSARYFGVLFNPVSFHYGWRADGALAWVVAEVNNTFGDRHLYPLGDLVRGGGGWTTRAPVPKAFHVSPFNDMSGAYRFSFSDIRESLDIRVDLIRGGEVVLKTRLAGAPRPFDGRHLARTIAAQPFSAALTIPRIAWQAGRLRFERKLPVHTRPEPASPMTIRRARPGLLARAAQAATFAVLRRMHAGTLTLELPDGTRHRFGGAGAGPDGYIRVRRARFFTRLARGGATGFGESFVDGDWDTPDLTALIRALAINRHRFEARARWLGAPARLVGTLLQRRRRNTRRGSRRNIRAHYDQGNDFFRLFLDPSMTYSCAVYRESGETLERAQRRKLDAVLRKARVGPGDHLLEIGSGWGSFALHAARETGCRVTGITLSREQLTLSRARAAEAGLADRVRFELCDYRDVGGRYDAIVSIEMLEAVGHEYLGAFFRRCDDLLKPGGRVVLQVITIDDRRYDAYRRSADWIQKHVFPGGHLPSIEAMGRAMERHSHLVVRDLERIGEHYATTLRAWREALIRHRDEALRLGADAAGIRKWAYYFSYSEAGFLEREIDDVQMVLERAGER